MKICKNCGIELEDHMVYCPLCGKFSDEGAREHQKRAATGDGHPHPVLSRQKSASPKSIFALIKRIFHV